MTRSPRWKRVRAAHLREHPSCEACGSFRSIEVHHVVPFQVDPERELDPSNLQTLCRFHHFRIGHDQDGDRENHEPDWRTWNRNTWNDATRLRHAQSRVQHLVAEARRNHNLY